MAESAAISEMRHNGTHLERTVHAQWQCTFPKGDCFKNHAPMEGLPEQMDVCTEEKAVSALEVVMAIDLTCAKMASVMSCKKGGPTGKQFDPFLLCNSDPLMLKAACHLECRYKKEWGAGFRPFEICMFEFDSGGKYNMSDKTVETCNLEATCKSPYVEQNEMFCSGRNTTKKHQAHWLTEEDAWKHREKHGIRAPPAALGETVDAGVDWVPKSLPKHRPMLFNFGIVFWIVAVVLILVSVWIHLGRQDCLPLPVQQCYEELNDRFHTFFNWTAAAQATFRAPRASQASLPYKGPSTRYSAPQVATSHGAKPAADDETLEFSAVVAS